MTTLSGRMTPHGNDLFREIPPAAASRVGVDRQPLQVTYWDLWMVVVLVNEFGGDWERMADHFRQEIKSDSYRQYAAEALLNHLRLLRQTFDRSGLTVEDVLGEAAPALLKRERRRARRAILEIYDAMRRAMESGQPYQTRLDPPPADSRVAHPASKTS